MRIPHEVRQLIADGALGHFVTLNPDGSPQVTAIWVAVDGDEIIAAHLSNQRKLKNIRKDPRGGSPSNPRPKTKAVSMNMPSWMVTHASRKAALRSYCEA